MKKGTSDGMTSHQQNFADVFNTISGLSPVSIPTELTDGNTKNVESIKATAEYVCRQLSEEDSFIEN